jgi:hypothetical protein
MRHVLYIGEHVLGLIREFFGAQVKYLKANCLVFRVEILQQRLSDEQLVRRSGVFASTLEKLSSRGYILGTDREANIVYPDKRWIYLRILQKFLVNLVHF